MNSTETPRPIDDDLRDQCVAYLLGELDADGAAALEARFDDAAVAAVLARESELIFQLASDPAWLVSSPPPPCPAPIASAPPTAIPTSDQTPRPAVEATPRLRHLGALIAAIAAVILVAFLLGRTGGNDSASVAMHDQPDATGSVSVEWELTRALVDPAIEWSEPQEAIETPDWRDEWTINAAEESITDDNLDWMVVAVKASQSDQENNDG